ncbi:MAG TPA: AraC family transcriptional regulator, partial [Leptospiraceae bacterium]|nr:AraC family transcriptional regulator [Leptospiraceae bacterium]
GPCLYLYTRMQTKNEKTFFKKDLLHFFPFLFFLFLTFISMIRMQNGSIYFERSKIFSVIEGIFAIAACISVSVYNILSYRMIKEHILQIQDKFSYLSIDNTLSWISRFSILFLIFLINQLVVFLYSTFYGKVLLNPVANVYLLLGFLYTLSFFFMRQDDVYNQTKNFEDIIKKEKYSKSGLSKTKMEQLENILLDYIEKEKPYLNPDLVISDIASGIGISTNHLSQIINTKFEKNFFMFINDFRIAEVIKKMNDSNYDEYPVIRIAYDCGFNSKSSFNSIFRKATGMTPAQFRSKRNRESNTL